MSTRVTASTYCNEVVQRIIPQVAALFSDGVLAGLSTNYNLGCATDHVRAIGGGAICILLRRASIVVASGGVDGSSCDSKRIVLRDS